MSHFTGLLDAQVVEFIDNLAYFRGYKSALFDSEFRFKNPGTEQAKQQLSEVQALGHLLRFVKKDLSDCSNINLSQLEKRISKDFLERYKDPDDRAYEAALLAAEKAIGILQDVQRNMKEAA